MRRQRVTAAWRRYFENHRLEQALTLQPSARQPIGDAFEEHPLVSDVLVDDGNPFIIDSHDERIAKLTEWNQRANQRFLAPTSTGAIGLS